MEVEAGAGFFPVAAAGAGVGDGCPLVLAAPVLAGLVVPDAAAGVGVGDGAFPACPAEPVLCAAAMVTRDASARIGISFISVPFVCCLIAPPYLVAGAGGF
jgi:hypothetical protein